MLHSADTPLLYPSTAPSLRSTMVKIKTQSISYNVENRESAAELLEWSVIQRSRIAVRPNLAKRLGVADPDDIVQKNYSIENRSYERMREQNV
ncbi:hypothetical protein EVAR_25408_1 [Eumeta japonica]|uniref:Uncharacterized protein n=1 Tax=Eumeta variegata TaxID=151549 RepID=A0A4C1V6E1_EUMVA|nr:hypothetical protein EVAR_25408_1 [Eumeta japonica]